MPRKVGQLLTRALARIRTIDPERFNNFCSGIQSIVVSLAVILGGLWTYFTFRTFRQTAKAEAEISVMERQLREQAAFDLDIDVAQESLPGDSAHYASISVRMKNVGNRNARIDFKKSVLSVDRVHFDNKGKMISSGAKISFKMQSDDEGVVVRANTSETIPFFVKLPGPGLYLLNFYSQVSPEEMQIAAQAGVPERARISWNRSRFFVVKPTTTP